MLSYIKTIKPVNPEETLSILYALSEKSLIVLLIIGMIIFKIFAPILGIEIYIWTAILIVLGVLRLYVAKNFKHDSEKYDIMVWYKIFTILTLLTASTLGALPFITFSKVDDFHQLFIILILIGLSAGATKTLAADIRIVSIYLSFLLLPILTNTLQNFILIDSLLLIFLVSQISIAMASNKMLIELKEKDQQLNKIKQIYDAKKDLFTYFLKEAPVTMFSYDLNLNLLNYNQSFIELFQRKTDSIKNLNQLPNKNISDLLKKVFTEGSQRFKGEYIAINGVKLWVDAVFFPFIDDKGRILGGIGIVQDETNEHKALNQLEYFSVHDDLTGLLNRRGFREYMKKLIIDKKHKTDYSLLFYLDLNQFKGINDALGHTIGDEVLLTVSQRLRDNLDKHCGLSRLGGDEFIILIPYICNTQIQARNSASKYTESIQKIFKEIFFIHDLHLYIQASIGIVVIEPNNNNIEEIIRHADISMYQAKNTAGHISYYDKLLDKKQKELFGLQHDLAYAVDRNQFDLFYQPIVKIKNEKIYSAEALIRWNHPQKGLLSPDAFIPLAIKAGLLSKITWWVLDEVCQHIADWKKFGLWHLEYVSINVNAQQLIENNFADEFLRKLETYGLETKDIVVEITERSLIDNFDSTQNVINALRTHGVRCAIDDFGVGYSSLSYLKKLSFHTLKIDREFVKDIESNPKELLLVSTILDIGRQFNYNIVIEGIEDKKQKDLLLGLDEELSYQGYYFSKPLEEEAFREKFLY